MPTTNTAAQSRFTFNHKAEALNDGSVRLMKKYYNEQMDLCELLEIAAKYFPQLSDEQAEATPDLYILFDLQNEQLLLYPSHKGVLLADKHISKGSKKLTFTTQPVDQSMHKLGVRLYQLKALVEEKVDLIQPAHVRLRFVHPHITATMM